MRYAPMTVRFGGSIQLRIPAPPPQVHCGASRGLRRGDAAAPLPGPKRRVTLQMRIFGGLAPRGDVDQPANRFPG